MLMVEEQTSELVNSLPARISDVVTKWAEKSPERSALAEASGSWTYAELSDAIAAIRKWLVAAGVRPGDRVMIVCENCRALVAVLLALASMDAWAVPVNARLSAREIDQIREHCGARSIVCTTQVSPHAREHAKRLGATNVDLAGVGPIAFGPLDEAVVPETFQPGDPGNVGVLIYTSGTTGLPKGVMLTHRGLLFVAAVSAKIRSLGSGDSLLGALPMSHAVGLSVVLLGALLSGATVQLMPRFDPVAVMRMLQQAQVTVMLGAPAMFSLFIEYAKTKGLASVHYPALRIISSSSAPLDENLKAQVEKFFGLVLHNGYGVTECSPNISQTRIEEPCSDLSVGQVLPGMEARLVGKDGAPVADGEVGELRVRGPNVMKGYYHAPEETAAALDEEGWFNTRDLAQFKGRNLYIIGRTKELIVRSGFNVYPVEVEAVLNSCPGVVQSAVIGRTLADDGNEEVVAFVQIATGASLSAKRLEDHAAGQLATYKRPSRIVILPSLPLTPTGKVAKAELAKMAADRNWNF